MQSRASFDLDSHNNPVLKLEIISTPDVRDKIAQRFIESLGHNSKWCVILPINEVEWRVWPLKPEELRRTGEYLIEQAVEFEKTAEAKDAAPIPSSIK